MLTDKEKVDTDGLIEADEEAESHGLQRPEKRSLSLFLSFHLTWAIPSLRVGSRT